MRRPVRLALLLRVLLALTLVLGPALGRHGMAAAGAGSGTAQMHRGADLPAPAASHAHERLKAAAHHPHPAAEHAAPDLSPQGPHAHAFAGECGSHGPAPSHGLPECCGQGGCWMACHLLALAAPPVCPAAAASQRVRPREVPDPAAIGREVAKPPPRALS